MKSGALTTGGSLKLNVWSFQDVKKGSLGDGSRPLPGVDRSVESECGVGIAGVGGVT